MNHVLVEFFDKGAHHLMRLSSDYTVDILFDSVHYQNIQPHNWCYDTGKGEVYMTDTKLNISKQLGIMSPRVYLWKYIAYLHSNKIVKAWRGRAPNDYRIAIDGKRNGFFIVEQAIQ